MVAILQILLIATQHPDIDVICVGEGEVTFANILREIASGNRDFSKIDGIAYGIEGDNGPRW